MVTVVSASSDRLVLVVADGRDNYSARLFDAKNRPVSAMRLVPVEPVSVLRAVVSQLRSIEYRARETSRAWEFDSGFLANVSDSRGQLVVR